MQNVFVIFPHCIMGALHIAAHLSVSVRPTLASDSRMVRL